MVVNISSNYTQNKAYCSHLELAVPAVHHEHDAVDGERCLGDVGGDDALADAVGGPLEYLGLQVGGQLRVDGKHGQRRGGVDLFEALGHQGARHLDVFLARHEHQDVAARLLQVDLYRV